jgi:hypothetical protein
MSSPRDHHKGRIAQTTSLQRARQHNKQIHSPRTTKTKRKKWGLIAKHEDVEKPSTDDNDGKSKE